MSAGVREEGSTSSPCCLFLGPYTCRRLDYCNKRTEATKVSVSTLVLGCSLTDSGCKRNKGRAAFYA